MQLTITQTWGIVFSSRYNSCVTGVQFVFNEIQKESHTTLWHLIVLSVFHFADSDVTVSLVALFVTVSLVAPCKGKFIGSRKGIHRFPKEKAATSGTSSISSCLAAEITRPPCSTKSWRLTLSDVFEVQALFEPSTPLKNTLRENTGYLNALPNNT